MIGETIPICDWEVFWKPRDAREEVILPRTNFPFRWVSAVNVGWGVLEACVLVANEGFNVMRCLVVHLMKLRFEALCFEVGIYQPVGLQELLL